MKVAIIVIIAACFLLASQVSAQPCPFTNNFNGYHATTVANLLTCYDAVTFNQTLADKLIEVVEKLQDLYSFADVSSAPVNQGSPYTNIEVGTTPFSGIYGSHASNSAFFLALQKAVNKYQDSHFTFSMPTPYKTAIIMTPFCLRSELDGNGNQILRAELPYVTAAGNFDAIPPTTTTNVHIGKVVSLINGVDAMTFVKTWTNGLLGLHRDPSIQFNAALGRNGLWCGRSVDLYPYDSTPASYDYTFGDASTATIANKVLSPPYANLAAFTAAIYSGQAKKRDVPSSSTGGIGHMEVNSYQQAYERTLESWPHEERLALSYLMTGRTLPLELLSTKVAQDNGFSPENTKKRTIDATSSRTNQFEWLGGFDGKIGGWALFNPSVGVLKIKDFEMPPGASSSFLNPIGTILKAMANRNLKNLIIDLTGNLGGLTGLAYNTLMWFTPEWERANFNKASVAMPPTSFRINPTTTAMRTAGAIPDIFLSSVTGQMMTPTDFMVTNKRSNVPRGSLTSDMTAISFLNLTADLTGQVYSQWGGDSGLALLPPPGTLKRSLSSLTVCVPRLAPNSLVVCAL